MAQVIRTSIDIDGTRLYDNDFSGVILTQNVGWHHTFEIRLRQDTGRGKLNQYAQNWISKKITIGFDAKEDNILDQAPIPKVFEGIVTSVGISRSSSSAELLVKGHSPTYFVDDGGNTQSFTDMGLQEIVDKVLGDYGSAFSEKEITPKKYTASIPYIVQYKESSFAFIARLANFYGEWMYYDGLKFHFGKPDKPKEIQLDFKDNRLLDFNISVKALPAKFKFNAYDYTQDKQLKEEAPQKAGMSKLGKTVYDLAQGSIFKNTTSIPINEDIDADGLKNLATREEEILVDESVILTGASRNPALVLGAKINVTDDETGEDYGDYTIVHLSHSIGQEGDYTNHFEAIPAEVSTPPLSTLPHPPYCETQLAKVVDVNDEDALGRIKVEFFWQTGTGETSPWIRVVSPYTGNDKGFYIIPEVEDQVLIAFENNNPERPYMLSGTYNKTAKPDWFDGKNRYKGFRSAGKNQLKFDDKNKHVLLSAPSSIALYAGKKIDISTGGKEDSEINLNTGEGKINLYAKEIVIHAEEKLTIYAKDKLEAISANEMTIDANTKISMATPELTADGSTKVEISGTQVTIEGLSKTEVKGAIVDVSGSGPVSVKGTPIKLN